MPPLQNLIEGNIVVPPNLYNTLTSPRTAILQRLVEGARDTFNPPMPVAPGLRREDFTDIPGSAQPNDATVQWGADLGMNMVGAPMFGVNAAAPATLGSGAVRKFGSLDEFRKSWDERGVRNFIADRPARNEMQLSDLVVPKEQRGQGVGTQFMKELLGIADEQGKTLTLTPAVRDDFYGTTSQSRLKEFYKRFGFVENKGRNKDFTISDSMYRKPSKSDTTLGSGSTDKRSAALVQLMKAPDALSGEILPPAGSTALPGVTNLQRAKLGPMLEQLEKLGATPEQIRTFTPVEAYKFIRDRNQ